MDEQISALAMGMVDRFGDRALDVAARQFDSAEGDVKLVWGRIMEWLVLHGDDRQD